MVWRFLRWLGVVSRFNPGDLVRVELVYGSRIAVVHEVVDDPHDGWVYMVKWLPGQSALGFGCWYDEDRLTPVAPEQVPFVFLGSLED